MTDKIYQIHSKWKWIYKKGNEVPIPGICRIVKVTKFPNCHMHGIKVDRLFVRQSSTTFLEWDSGNEQVFISWCGEGCGSRPTEAGETLIIGETIITLILVESSYEKLVFFSTV